MEQYKIQLESISPMKMDAWVDGDQPKNEEGYKKLAEKKVYRDEKGNISLPSGAIKAAMKYASSEIGKKTMAKKNRQTIMSAIFIEPIMISLGKKNHDGIVRDIVTRGQGMKVTRVPTYRPIISSWNCEFTINSFGVPEDFIKECIQLAGQRYGLLSHRPEFGRFILSKFQRIK